MKLPVESNEAMLVAPYLKYSFEPDWTTEKFAVAKVVAAAAVVAVAALPVMLKFCVLPLATAILRVVVLRYRTYTLLVPADGATENVRVVPDTKYPLGICATLLTKTSMSLTELTARLMVKLTADPVPLK